MNRTSRSGGGIMAVYNPKTIKIKKIPNSIKYQSFEILELSLIFPDITYRLVNLYRPPYSKKNRVPTSIFFKEFEDMLQRINSQNGKRLIMGDLNIHVDNKLSSDTKRFEELLINYDLKQQIDEPTHDKGHTLDVVITENNDSNIINTTVTDCTFSDHKLIVIHSKLANNFRPQTVTFRNFKHLDINDFCAAIFDSQIADKVMEAPSISDKIDICNTTLRTIVETLCPLKTNKVVIRPNTQWYNEDIKHTKKELRTAENKWKRTKLEIHKQIYKTLRKKRNQIIKIARSEYIKNEIISNKNNFSNLYKTINKLTNKENISLKLPDNDNHSELANKFAQYFRQ